MPGAVVHFLVLNEILNRIKLNKADRSLLYAGVIAPDAVHAKVDYIREHKKASHLRTDIRDAEFHLESNLNLFYKRTKDFCNNHIVKDNRKKLFYMGYLIHLYTDEMFILSLRKEYKEWKEDQGYTLENRHFYKDFIEDVEVLDSHMLNQLGNQEDIVKGLNELRTELKVLNLSSEELNMSRKWIIKNKLRNNPIEKETVYIEVDRVNLFIEWSSNEIYKRLKDRLTLEEI